MTDLRAVAQQALEALEFSSLDSFMCAPISPGRESTIKAITALRAALAEPVQEPVAWWHRKSDTFTSGNLISKFDEWTPLYPAPPQRKPLTDEEIKACEKQAMVNGALPFEQRVFFARAIERAHGIGDNT